MSTLAVVKVKETPSPEEEKVKYNDNSLAILKRELAVFEGLKAADSPYTISQRIKLAENILQQAQELLDNAKNAREGLLRALGVE